MKVRSNLAAPILAMSMCLFAAAAARAEVYYLRGAPCRIYVDTDFIGLPDQCGTLARLIRAMHSCRVSGGSIRSMVDITDNAGRSAGVDEAFPAPPSLRLFRRDLTARCHFLRGLLWPDRSGLRLGRHDDDRVLHRLDRRRLGLAVSQILQPILQPVTGMNDRAGNGRGKLAGLRHNAARRGQQSDGEAGRNPEMRSHREES